MHVGYHVSSSFEAGMFRLTRSLVLLRGLSTSAPRLEKFLDRVQLMGRVGSDPRVNTELRDGDKLVTGVTFKLGTKHVKKITHHDGSLSNKDEMLWHTIVIFRKSLQDYVLEWVTKGSRVVLDGDITYSGQESEDGTTRHFKNIILRDLTKLSDGWREEQSVTDSNDTGSNEDLVDKESGMAVHTTST